MPSLFTPSYIHKKNIRRRLFLVELYESLCASQIQQRTRLPRLPNALAVVNSYRNQDFPSTSVAAVVEETGSKFIY